MRCLLAFLLTTGIAEAGAYITCISSAVGSSAVGRETPGPTPPVSDVCENCNGTGKLGDGTVFVTCPECNGTGKRTKAISQQGVADGHDVNGVFWHSDYDSAYGLAVELDLPLLLFFTRSDGTCRPCEELKAMQRDSVVSDVLRRKYVCVLMPLTDANKHKYDAHRVPVQIVEKHGNVLIRWRSNLWRGNPGAYAMSLRDQSM